MDALYRARERIEALLESHASLDHRRISAARIFDELEAAFERSRPVCEICRLAASKICRTCGSDTR